jgi:hypothetical protein
LRARGALCCGALLWIRCAIALIAESLRVDTRGGFVIQFDHYVHFAGLGKLILLEIADGVVVGVLRAIEVVALSVRDVVRSNDEVRE